MFTPHIQLILQSTMLSNENTSRVHSSRAPSIWHKALQKLPGQVWQIKLKNILKFGVVFIQIQIYFTSTHDVGGTDKKPTTIQLDRGPCHFQSLCAKYRKKKKTITRME